ncbi:MAG: DNA polymerase I [Candidatus Marinimicrobia bacterium]|nr:DNA polymerase I [Candidatus Neomarinimicrobiota bacterium]
MDSGKSGRKNLFIIDGHASLYRSHFALIRNPLITTYGLHTSAIFGFLKQIMKILQEEDPDYFACAFDSKEKTFRHKIFPDYKATRKPMPEEMQEQLPHLWELLEAMNIPILKKPGVEADDIIGTLAIAAEKDGIDTYIVSGDKDFMQLINEHIRLYSPGTRKSPGPILYSPEKVYEKWGVYPEKIVDLLGLMGDSSDNVPGVAGVGVKTAVKLIREYGSLEGALENAHQVSNKRVQKGLKEGSENALMSKELVTILTNVELDHSLDDFVRTDIDLKKTRQKFTDLEFHALIKNLDDDPKERAISDQEMRENKNYNTLIAKKDLDQLIETLLQAELISFDLETTSVVPMEAEIVGLSFSTEKNSGWYIPIKYFKKEKENFGDDDLTIVLDALRPVLENDGVKKTGQNIKFDALVMRHHDIILGGISFDTMIAAHLLNPSARSYKLDTLSLEYLNYDMVPIEDLIGKGREQITMADVPLEQASFYAVEDADITLQLTQIFKTKLKEEQLYSFFNLIEIPMIPVLTAMEHTGVFVDNEFLSAMSLEIGKKIDSLIIRIHQLSGTEFNINSTKQLATILFDVLGLTEIKKRSTAENVLKQLEKDNELPGLILEYRKYNKLRNTYVDALPDLILKETQRIHSTFHQTIAATGRLSSTNPNFQNIPIRTEEGREIRKAFRSHRKGWKIFSADYSQIELRIMAHLSQDEALCDAFEKGHDVHNRTASNVFGVSVDDVLPEMRRIAKVVNFGIMYGAGPFRMSQELDITRSDAGKIIESYFEQFSGIRRYIDSILEKARKDRFVETILGRRRPVWDLDSENGLRRKAAERMTINMPIQGSAAEMIKLAMITIQERLRLNKMRSKMILQIHDELLFEFHAEEEKELIPMVIDSMEKAMPLSVPVIVDYGIGDNWYEAH